MKTYLIILIAICTLFSKVYGQSSSGAIDTLIKYKVITPKDRRIIEEEFKYERGVSDQVVILAGLETVLDRKIFHVDPHTTGLFYSYRYDKPDQKRQDSVNISLRGLLEKINKAGLLTSRVYDYALRQIDSSQYVEGLQMIPHLVEMSSRLEWMAPAKLLPVVDTLHNDGVISDTSFLRLKNDIRDGKIESSFQLDSYFKFGETFDLTKYAKDSIDWIEPYLHKIASILPNLNFSNFSYVIEPDATFDFKIKGDTKIKTKVSITCNGRIYKYAIPSDRITGRDGKIHYIGIVDAYMYRIFNKILADQHSFYRIHNIHFYHAGEEEDESKHFAVIALKDTQAMAFMKHSYLSYMLVSFEDYDNTFTSSRIDTTIMEWQKIGLFAHLSQAEIDKGIDDAETADRFASGSVSGLLNNFPRIVCQLNKSFVVPRNPYADFLMRLAAITHGAFNPRKITEHKIKGGVKLQYISKSRSHYAVLDNEPWIDLKTAKFLKTLGRENDLPGDFYILPGGYEVIYLTKQQCAFAAAHKLLFKYD